MSVSLMPLAGEHITATVMHPISRPLSNFFTDLPPSVKHVGIVLGADTLLPQRVSHFFASVPWTIVLEPFHRLPDLEVFGCTISGRNAQHGPIVWTVDRDIRLRAAVRPTLPFRRGEPIRRGRFRKLTDL